jgi:arylsulfatase A
MRLTLLAPILSLLLLTVCTTFAAEQTPNVVLIFADDLGHGDLGCYGATKVQTPNIDRLAAEGRRFTDAHSASAVCTPSRYALLTGEYPVRGNGGRGVWGPAPITSPLIVNTEKTTMADVFKSGGYDTAVVGKWHLGFGTETNKWQEPLRPGPQDLGFDYYFGMPVVNSAPPYVYVENDRVVGSDPDDPLVYLGRNAKNATPITPIPPEAANRSRNAFGGAKEAHKLFNDYQVGTTFAEKSVEWIKDRKDKPFFLYLATTNIHHPFTPAKRFQGTSQCGLYGDFIHELDWIVGEILSCLEDNGLSDNTLVIFTSDNGGMFNFGGQAAFKAGHRQNGDLLGFKFGVWEGGHRVPMIVRWPGKVKAGTTSNQVISNVDMLATFAAMTGQDLDESQQADSVNMLPAFVREPEEQIRDHLILAPNKGTHLSVRKGKWMYIPAQGSGGFGGRTPNSHTFAGPAAATFVGSVNSDIEDGKIKKDSPSAQLYDLEADVNETKNVYREHPEVVKELSALLAEYKPVAPKRPAGRGNPRSKPAKKMPATPSTRSASFDFESGKLAPWKAVEGKFGHIIGSRPEFFRNGRQYNKQGTYYLTTLESSADAERGLDDQTGVIVSPLFIPKAGMMTFRVGGGGGRSTYVALCTADGKEVQFARGIGDQVMQQAEWDLTPYAGMKMFLKVVDKAAGGWGHITVDNFQFDAEILGGYPELTAKTSSAAPAETRGLDRRATPEGPASTPQSGQSARLPNVIFMLSDDLGYSDIGCYGAEKVKTPHIDRLAAEGFRFTDFHTAASICSPSRAAFLTGGYPQRAGLYMGINPNRTAHWFLGLNPDEITIAEQFQQQGYATHMVGKWHLGTEPEFLPGTQGFDHYYGMPCNFAHSPKFIDDNEEVFAKTPLDQLTQLYTERVTSIIGDSAKRGEPFFLYYAHNYPHTPFQAGKDFRGTSQDGIRGDVMQELDWSVGEMMTALKEAGVADNTIIIFTSDNGPTANQYAKPYRGTKYVTFEGGHRVPFIFHWPARIKEPSVSEVSINAMDLFPTLSEIISAELPTDRVYDGESLLPLFDGAPLKRTASEPFFYYNCENLQAVRRGDWKLHLPRKPEQLPFWEKNKTFANLQNPVLYNLHSDQAETTNVAEDNPEVVRQILNTAESARKELGEFMQRGKSQRPTGSLFPDGPIVSHEKDWGTVASATVEAIARERQKRHPNQKPPKSRRKKLK